jgi:hypothetical protein
MREREREDPPKNGVKVIEGNQKKNEKRWVQNPTSN